MYRQINNDLGPKVKGQGRMTKTRVLLSEWLSRWLSARSEGHTGVARIKNWGLPNWTSEAKDQQNISGFIYMVLKSSDYVCKYIYHCSAPPVSEMTYTVSSGTLNSTIPYHTVYVKCLHLRNCFCTV